MSVRAPVRGASLAQQIQEILTERIKNNSYPPQSQIPPEKQLAAEFKVSRATIRSAISALVERGLLMRRHGVGTFVSQRSGLSNPLNEAIDFNHLIANSGFTPGVRHINTQLLSPKPEIAQALRITPEQLVIRDYKIFTANNDPVIYCLNIIPAWIFDEVLLDEILAHPEITAPLYDFLEQRSEQQVEYFIAKIRADTARNCEFPEMSSDPLAPVLVIEEVAHNSDEIPLWYALEYFPNNSMSFELVRRRIRSR